MRLTNPLNGYRLGVSYEEERFERMKYQGKSAEALFGVKHQRLAGGGLFVSGAVRVLVNSGNPGLDCVIDFWQGV